MAQSLAEIMAGLNPAYDPERNVINTQVAALPGAAAADIAGLDTAKTNAFSDITNAANARGVLYSGAPINEQNKYVGEKYLPARAAVAENYANRTSDFQLKLAQIGQRQSERAQGIQADQQKTEADAAYRAEQLRIQQEAARQKAVSGGSSRAAVDPAKGFLKGSDAGGGLSYRDARGNPITSAQYYEAKGATGIGAIIADLRSSKNPGDAKIANDASSGKYTYDQLMQKYPYVFGGV